MEGVAAVAFFRVFDSRETVIVGRAEGLAGFNGHAGGVCVGGTV